MLTGSPFPVRSAVHGSTQRLWAGPLDCPPAIHSSVRAGLTQCVKLAAAPRCPRPGTSRRAAPSRGCTPRVRCGTDMRLLCVPGQLQPACNVLHISHDRSATTACRALARVVTPMLLHGYLLKDPVGAAAAWPARLPGAERRAPLPLLMQSVAVSVPVSARGPDGQLCSCSSHCSNVCLPASKASSRADSSESCEAVGRLSVQRQPVSTASQR